MIGFAVLRPEFLLLLLLVPAMALAWYRWPPPLTRARGRVVLVSRALLVALLVLALAGVRLTTQPDKRAMVAVVDLSASVKAHGSLDTEAATVKALQSAKGPDDMFGVVTFGHDAAVELPLTRDPAFESFQTQPDPSYTDIAGALRLAAGLLPDGYARQLVLISDGRQNLNDAGSAVAALRAEGVRVDVVAVGEAPASEALVSGVDVPSEMREGQTATAVVHLQSTGQASGRLTLIMDNRGVDSRDVTLPAGSSTQSFQLPTADLGLHTIRAELTVTPDTYTENNVGEANLRVLGRPVVLVLEGKVGEGANVGAALQAAGMNVERRQAAGAPTDTATLGRYDATVVVNAPTDSFPRDSLSALASSVHDLGKGLVTVGGATAYGPGGWQGTPLEDALPVRMDIPQRKDKPKVAVVLVMETMEDPRADQVVMGAAEGVIDKLSPDDLVAVTDGRPDNTGFLVDMTTASNKKTIDSKLEAAAPGDPPSYLPYMQRAVDALQKTDAPLKHIVVLGDGDADSTPAQQIQTFLEGSLAKGVTTSAIAVDVHGQPQYMSFMQDVARWGGGRFYQSNNPSQVPDLFLKESIASLRPWFEQTPFFPKIAAAGDLLQGVPTDAFPQLGGYVVTTAKPSSEQYLSSVKQDPVLAAWSYGLGRSVAWTSDSNGVWTGGFLRSPVSQTLFARMVGWTLPNAQQQLQIEAQPSGDGLQVDVTGPDTAGAMVSVGTVRPDLQSSTQDLVAVAPGHWKGRIGGTTVGTYLLHGVLKKNGQVLGQADRAVSVPYSPEYLQLGRDDGLLRQVAHEGSGVLLAKAAAAWQQRPLPVPISSDVFWPLILLAALLWPLDVATRRITLSPRQLVANAVGLVTERRARDLEVAVPAELTRLRERVASTRARRAPGPPPPLVTEAEDRSRAPADRRAPGATPAPPAAGRRQEEEALSARLLEARRKRR
ncbi:MAG TPA: VWA domain-containing protein, partial [Candidatus Dormibacteraeota bacterium]